jgi:hypothetical protein
MIEIDKNRFSNVNYAFYGDKDPAVTWMHLSDSHFTRNTVNVAVISHVYVKAVDGLHVIGNTFFFPNYATTNNALKQAKKQNVYVGQSNWVFICHNNMFEAGEESIWLDMPSIFTISDNLIAWPGQKQPSSAVKLTGNTNVNGTVADNVFSKFTANAVDIYCTGTGTVTVKDNSAIYDAATPSYYGATALNSFEHYALYQDISSTVNFFEQGNDYSNGLYVYKRGSLISTIRVNNDAGISQQRAVVAFTAATAAPVFTLNSHRNGQITMSGEVLMEVKNADLENSNLAIYKLLISKSTGSNYSITEEFKQGLTQGTNANWPSFTWSIDNATGKLIATPVGATAGTFYFNPFAMGNLKLMAA